MDYTTTLRAGAITSSPSVGGLGCILLAILLLVSDVLELDRIETTRNLAWPGNKCQGWTDEGAKIIYLRFSKSEGDNPTRITGAPPKYSEYVWKLIVADMSTTLRSER